MDRLKNTLDKIQALDDEWKRVAQRRLDRLTKPPGSLGRLEDIAKWYIQVTGKCPPRLPKKILFTLAADHGVVEEGVSAYPKAVTAQMVHNFLKGGAAINVLARHVGTEIRVVDMGVDFDFKKIPGLVDKKIRRGTQNMTKGAAMSREDARASLTSGIEMAEEAARGGAGLIGTGEMGIGNTTASSAIVSVLTHAPVHRVCGRGTGIDDRRLAHKQKVIDAAIALNQPDPTDPIEVLAKVGGFEIGGLAGLMLGAAAHRIPIVLDGFIASAAALVAVGMKPETKAYLLAAHQSAEPGHAIALRHLGLSPLLAFNMRLGEGTGAALGITLVDAAIKIVNEMATFASAGVSEKAERR